MKSSHWFKMMNHFMVSHSKSFFFVPPDLHWRSTSSDVLTISEIWNPRKAASQSNSWIWKPGWRVREPSRLAEAWFVLGGFSKRDYGRGGGIRFAIYPRPKNCTTYFVFLHLGGPEKGRFEGVGMIYFSEVFFGRRTAWIFGRTPPWAMVTPPRSLFNSSSFFIFS